MFKNIIRHIGLLFLIELALIPLYLFIFIGLAFNDSDFTTSSFFVFFKMLIPIYAYLIATVSIAIASRKLFKLHRVVVWFIFIPIHLIISVFCMFMYMDTYMPNEINSKYNPIKKQQIQRTEENKQKQLKSQTQSYERYLENKEEYTVLYTKELDDIHYEIVKNNQNKIYFVYVNDSNNSKWIEVMENTEIPENLTPTDSRLIYSSDSRLDIYFLYYDNEIGQGELSNHSFYINIPELDFHFELQSNFHTNNTVIVNNENRNLDNFISDLFMQEIFLEMITYKNGQLSRTGETDYNISWNISENGKHRLTRSAKDELVLSLSDLPDVFLEGNTYTVYLEEYILYENKYIQISPVITFEP